MEKHFLGHLIPAIESVAATQFEKFLADAMSALVDCDFISMVRYSVSDEPRFLIHSHTFPTHMAELYLGEFVSCDPYLHHWRSTGQPGVVWLQDIMRGHSTFDRYTKDFLPKIGVADEIGVFLPAVGSDSVTIFFNKHEALFEENEIRSLKQVFDGCAALYRLHIRTLLTSPEGGIQKSPSLGRPLRLTNSTGATIWVTNEWDAQVTPDSEVTQVPLDESFGIENRYLWTIASDAQKLEKADMTAFKIWASSIGLTPRERDIVNLIFQGQNGTGIAEKLNLSLGNIKNHKRRIYRKLDITSERELFLMFFGAVSE